MRMLPVKTGLIQLKDLCFFFRAMLNIRIFVGLIHVPAYAKLVILETETVAKVCKGDTATFAVRF